MQQIVDTSYHGEGKLAGEGNLSLGGFNKVKLWVILILCMFEFLCIKKNKMTTTYFYFLTCEFGDVLFRKN